MIKISKPKELLDDKDIAWLYGSDHVVKTV